MNVYQRKIRVQDTDATGVLYFANQLQIGLEAFEDYLAAEGFSLKKMVDEKKFLLPIVHAESDFFEPVFLGDTLDVTLSFPKVGTSSFTHASDILKEGKKVGWVSIVHVAVCPQKNASIPIPRFLLDKILTCS